MFNVGGGEVFVILVVALLVLGPRQLPAAAKQVGQFMTELRKMSSGFQNELKSALDAEDTATPASDAAGGQAPASDAAPPETAAAAPDQPDGEIQGDS